MDIEKFAELQKNIRKGCYYRVEYKSIKKVKGNTIEKHSNGVYRLGISYKNLKVNKDKETKSLPYGEWEITNFIIKNENNFQLRLYNSNCKYHKTKTFYLLNGKPITKEELISMELLDNKEKKPLTCFNIKLENLINIDIKD